jgi:hypothetical protein
MTPSDSPGSFVSASSGSCWLPLFLLRFQLARMRVIPFHIILQFLERPSTNSAHLKLQQRYQEQAREKTEVKLCLHFN